MGPYMNNDDNNRSIHNALSMLLAFSKVQYTN